jgi:PGF-CTERM protein
VTTQFSESGEYTAQLTVRNDAGETDTDSVVIIVESNSASSDEPTQETTADEQTDDGIPGFGPLVAVLALVALALAARRKQ